MDTHHDDGHEPVERKHDCLKQVHAVPLFVGLGQDCRAYSLPPSAAAVAMPPEYAAPTATPRDRPGGSGGTPKAEDDRAVLRRCPHAHDSRSPLGGRPGGIPSGSCHQDRCGRRRSGRHKAPRSRGPHTRTKLRTRPRNSRAPGVEALSVRPAFLALRSLEREALRLFSLVDYSASSWNLSPALKTITRLRRRIGVTSQRAFAMIRPA